MEQKGHTAESETWAGKMLGRYQVLELLGRGGMGEVYRARDPRLGREVAIKVLPAAFAADREHRQRFEQEARAASALNHPNILTIHEFGQEPAADGDAYFIVSELIAGETLRRRMAEKRLSPSELPNIARQIASALQAAHEAGVIHRDIKPENVMIRPDGLVKVLDFGLAKLPDALSPVFDTAAPTLRFKTAPGVVMGTVAYMSPEQARGQKLDARSDLFSLGAMLYEMAAGQSPFARETPADTLAAILEKEPPPLPPTVSAPLAALIGKALRKNRDERHQTAAELLGELHRLPEKQGSLTQSFFKRRWRGLALALVGMLAAGGAISYWRASQNGKAIESLAVLPFIASPADAETEAIAFGLTEALVNDLSQLHELKVRPRNLVFRYQNRELDPLAAGRELEVEAVLTGQTTVQSGDITLSLQLISVRENRQLWGGRYRRLLATLPTLQSDIARDVTTHLRLQTPPPAARRAGSDEASRAYFYGRHFWNKRTQEGFKQAGIYFHQAIAADPNYAPAWAGLADYHLARATYNLSPPQESFPEAKAAARKALALDNTLAEAHATLANIAWIYDWQWAEAERGFKQSLGLDPNYATAHQWYAIYLSCLARHDEAVAEIKRAQMLDPVSTIIASDVSRVLYFAQRYDEAIKQALKARAANPEFPHFDHWLRMAYEQEKRYDEAFAEMIRVMAARNVKSDDVAAHREIYAASGWQGFWRKRREQVENAKGPPPLPTLTIAGIYARLGDNDKALQWLEKAYQQRSDLLVTLKVDPVFDKLHADPRFVDLLRRIGLAP